MAEGRASRVYRVGQLTISLLIAAALQAPADDGAAAPDYLAVSRQVGAGHGKLQWHDVFALDLAAADGLTPYQVINGEWSISQQALVARSGDENRGLLLCRAFDGAIRVQAEVACYAGADGNLGDISILIGSQNTKAFFKTGYVLTTGSYYNHCSTIYRLGQPLAKTEYSPLTSGRTNRVQIDAVNGHLRYWLNDEIILEAWDRTPLVFADGSWIGIRTWNTRMQITSFQVAQGIGSATRQ